MNTNEFVKRVANVSGLTHKQSKAAIDAFVEVMTDILKDGDKIALKGLGTFEVRERNARTGHNPKTGETIDIPASKSPAFKPSTTLKSAVKDK